ETFSRSGITYCSQTSFDSRLSERNVPFGSDRSVVNCQKSWSESFWGSVAAAAGAAVVGGGLLGAAATGAGAGTDGGVCGACGAAECAAQEIGPAAIRSPSDSANAKRFNMFEFDPAPRILTESRRAQGARGAEGA